MPVYVNGEMIPAVRASPEPWAENVYAVEGFDYATTSQVLEDSLAAGSDLVDLDVPIFAVAASAARNLHGWWKGSVPLQDLPFEIIIDGAVHGGLSVAGGFTASALGGLVFGPAGAVVFGGIGGVAALFGAGRTRQTIRRLWRRKQYRLLGESIDRFEIALALALNQTIRRKRQKIAQLETEMQNSAHTAHGHADVAADRAVANPTLWKRFRVWLSGLFMWKERRESLLWPLAPATPNQIVAQWMRLKFEDQILCVAECRAAMDRMTPDKIERARELLRVMREAHVHPLAVKEEFQELCTALQEWRR